MCQKRIHLKNHIHVFMDISIHICEEARQQSVPDVFTNRKFVNRSIDNTSITEDGDPFFNINGALNFCNGISTG